jgi:preprotein translocase subunit Sec63
MIRMSTGRRAYDMLRGYVNQEWERIRGVDDKDAEAELRDSMSINSIQIERTEVITRAATPEETRAWAMKILGISEASEFTEIRKAFERLNTRSDPANFPAGSPEAKQAGEIQAKVRQAYSLLTDEIDSTEKRFKSLEID